MNTNLQNSLDVQGNNDDFFRELSDTVPFAFEELKKIRNSRDPNDLLLRALFGWDTPVENEPDIIFFGNTPVASLSNISLLAGQRKTGKSTVQALILGDTSGVIQRRLPVDKNKIVYVDTEQSGRYIRKFQERITALYGRRPDNIECLRLRDYSINDRIMAISEAVEGIPGIGLVLIDNAKDICQDFNDNGCASETIDRLISWTQQYNIHIMSALHQNKGNMLNRGHLGTEFENKAQTTINTSKEGDMYKVTPGFTRDKPFEPFAYRYDENGIPVLTPAARDQSRDIKKKDDPWTHEPRVHMTLLGEIFSGEASFKYDTMWRAIKNKAARYDIKLADNKCKYWLTHYKEEGYIKYDAEARVYQLV